jgi:predicted HicB family RNase H-like nuclease
MKNEISNKEEKQINFFISCALHQQIKILAARHNISMTLLICRAIEQFIKRETQYDKELGNMSK